MKDVDVVIDKRIKAFVDELQALVRAAAVEAVGRALGVKQAAVATRRQAVVATRRKAAPKKGGKRTPEQLAATVTRVQQHVQANPGQTVEQIGKTLGLATKALALPLRKLLAGGEVRKTGVKRRTRYFPAEGKKVAKKRGAKRSKKAGKK
jgi:hypothetical protein